MLEQLTIRGLALLDHVSLGPTAGLTVISGETGGGKSLVVQALRLLRGEKGRSDLVRRGATAVTVDGTFRLEKGERSNYVRELYHEVLGTHPEEDRIVVSRVLDAKGRSRARVDGRPLPIRELQRFGSLLLEIHGQGANRSLMRAEIQTELVDAFAGISERRRGFARELASARELAREVREARESQRDRRDRIDWLRHCLGEIERARVEAGERGALERESKILGSVDRLRETLGRSLVELREDDEAAILDRLRRVCRETDALTELDDRLADPVRMLDEAAILVDEASHVIASALDRLEFDPLRAEATRARLAELDKLFDRFGPTEAELFETRDRMRDELDRLEDETRSPAALEARLVECSAELETIGTKLTKDRRRAAKRLSVLMVRELADLGMSQVRVEVRVIEHDGEDPLARATELGTSEVEVFLAPNPGEPMTALRETASGGEVARVMLVLKKILADADRVPVLVFDEADAEIGGRLGLAVGRKLQDVASEHQVLCVTHLPQIAAFADLHCLVKKRVENVDGENGNEVRTIAELRILSKGERERELASMSRGEAAVDDDALREAGRLLELARGDSS